MHVTGDKSTARLDSPDLQQPSKSPAVCPTALPAGGPEGKGQYQGCTPGTPTTSPPTTSPPTTSPPTHTTPPFRHFVIAAPCYQTSHAPQSCHAQTISLVGWPELVKSFLLLQTHAFMKSCFMFIALCHCVDGSCAAETVSSLTHSLTVSE